MSYKHIDLILPADMLGPIHLYVIFDTRSLTPKSAITNDTFRNFNMEMVFPLKPTRKKITLKTNTKTYTIMNLFFFTKMFTLRPLAFMCKKLKQFR